MWVSPWTWAGTGVWAPTLRSVMAGVAAGRDRKAAASVARILQWLLDFR